MRAIPSPTLSPAGGIDMFAAENYVPNATVNTWNNTAKGGILRGA